MPALGNAVNHFLSASRAERCRLRSWPYLVFTQYRLDLFGRVRFPQTGCQHLPVDQLDIATGGELDRLGREVARSHHEPAGRLARGHCTVELPNRGDGHFACPPMLALDQEKLSVAPQLNIHAAVGSSPVVFSHGKTALAKQFADQALELAPAQVGNTVNGFGRGCSMD